MQSIVKSVDLDHNPIEEVFIVGIFCPDGMPWEYDFYNPSKNPLSDVIKNETPSYDTIPHLSEMTAAALNMLDNDPNGFFLMVEGGTIDWAGHDNNIEDNVFETLEFAKAFQVATDWIQDQNDTLIIVGYDLLDGGTAETAHPQNGYQRWNDQHVDNKFTHRPALGNPGNEHTDEWRPGYPPGPIKRRPAVQ